MQVRRPAACLVSLMLVMMWPFPFQFNLAKPKCWDKSPRCHRFHGSLVQHSSPHGLLCPSPPRPQPKSPSTAGTCFAVQQHC